MQRAAADGICLRLNGAYADVPKRHSDANPTRAPRESIFLNAGPVKRLPLTWRRRLASKFDLRARSLRSAA